MPKFAGRGFGLIGGDYVTLLPHWEHRIEVIAVKKSVTFESYQKVLSKRILKENYNISINIFHH